MHGSRFDRLSRTFATCHGRRATLAGLGGAIAGLLNRAAGLEDAEARLRVCRPRGSRCFPDRGLDCCGNATCRKGRCRVQKRKRRPKKCKPTRNRCCRNGNCPNNLICHKGNCRCRAGEKRCEDRCIARDTCCGCETGQLCRNGTCVAARCGHGTPCRVFLSELNYSADLGGLDGADARCQEAADSSGLTSGGTYRAWLSTGAQSPTTRFNHVASSGPFELVNGDVVATSWGELISGADLINHISVTQNNDPWDASVWTNTTANGTPVGENDCNGWTNAATGNGRTGESDSIDATWTDYFDAPCSSNRRMYCFEQR